MNTNNTTEYLVSVLEKELDRLGVERNFVKDISVFHCKSKEDGRCDPTFKNGKMDGVVIAIMEEKSKRTCRDKIIHEAKHAQQYFQKGRLYVEQINPVYSQLEAYAYQLKRSIEEDFKTICRKLKNSLSRS